MATLLLGLGNSSCDPDPEAEARGAGRVVVPQGTTVQLHSDLGEGLRFGPPQYAMWQQLFSATPQEAGSTVANIALRHGDGVAHESLGAQADFLEHELVRPGLDGVPDPLLLCTGTPDTCSADVQGVHSCDGALARYPGELHVVVCAALHPVDGDPARSLTTLWNPRTDPEPEDWGSVEPMEVEWRPRAEDLRRVAAYNQRLLGDGYGKELYYLFGGRLLLFSATKSFDQYATECTGYVWRQATVVQGTLTHHWGGGIITDVVEVKGAPRKEHAAIKRAVHGFHLCSVIFG